MSEYSTKVRIVAALEALDKAQIAAESSASEVQFELTIIGMSPLPAVFLGTYKPIMLRLKAHNFPLCDVVELLRTGEFKRLDGTFKIKIIGE